MGGPYPVRHVIYYQSQNRDLVIIPSSFRLVAQLYPTYGPASDNSALPHEPSNPQEFERSFLQGHAQIAGRWASFNWADLWAIAPWLKESIPKQIDGMGLGIGVE